MYLILVIPDFNLDYGNENMIYFNDVMFLRQLDIDEKQEGGNCFLAYFAKTLQKMF